VIQLNDPAILGFPITDWLEKSFDVDLKDEYLTIIRVI